VRVEGPSVPLGPQEAQTVTLLLHELATNAAKYGALRAPGGALSVSWRISGQRMLEIDWKEAVPAGEDRPIRPGRGGFGSALLTRVVQQQLGGTISRSFAGGGLRCALAFPLAKTRLPSERPDSTPGDTAAAAQDRDRKSVLIVEDEAIIALDLEELVGGLGYDVFDTVASVTDGLKALETGTPSLAIVDMNLAGHSSRPIAEALSARGVPIIFATGYADVSDLPESLAHAPRLSKPISRSELVRTISALAS
jgi:CheY-like chemotaxis protein